MTTVSGLLKMKPDGPYPAPEKDQVRRLSVHPTPKRDKPDETWNRLKNEKGEEYGANYKVLKCDKLDGSDDHGNVTYSLLLEPSSQEGAGASPNQLGGASPATSDSARDESIALAVAFKEASRIHAASVLPNADYTVEQHTQRVRTLTNALLPIVRGETDEVTVPPSPAPDNGAGHPQAEEGDDIPFAVIP